MSQNEITTIESKVKLINHYEAIAKDASESAEQIKTEIKEFMSDRALDTITTPNFIIRWIDVLSQRFDTKRFKEDFGMDSYAAYCKQVASKKFTITQ